MPEWPTDVKTQQDLLIAIERMHKQYAAGRIDREILRGWVLGLPSYPDPHGTEIDRLKQWFTPRQTDITDEIRVQDLEKLANVATAAGRG